ncbi:MAG: hypothetical protein AB9834_00485 [Lentimicrobium sp.]
MFEQNIALGPGTEAFSSHLVEIVILLLGAAILGFIIGWLFRKSYKKEFFAMKTDHDKCPGIKAGLEKNIQELEAELVNCRTDLGKARDMNFSLTTEKEGLQATLNTKMADLDAANAGIALLQKEIKALKEQSGSLKVKYESESARLNDEIKHLKADLLTRAVKVADVPPVAFVPDMKLAAEIFGKDYKADDLKIVEGIGPKIEELFHAAGIKSWNQLSVTPAEKLKSILETGGDQFKLHDPATWPQQARLAAQGLWNELKELQDKLQGGKI